MPKLKQIFVCTECGYESPKWNGQCPQCRAWNTMEEKTVQQTGKHSAGSSAKAVSIKKLNEVEGGSEMRFSTGAALF